MACSYRHRSFHGAEGVMRSGPEGAISQSKTALLRYADTILTSSPPASTKNGGTP